MELARQDIEKGLHDLGLKKGNTVEVHSSLSSFGHIHGGAATVVDALMNVVGRDGALLMSNYPLSRPLALTAAEKAKGIGWKLRILPEDSDERTTTGAVSDEFRRRSDVICGVGIHRVCAWGRDADLHSRGYQHLLDTDGLVILLGVDIDRCSSMHLAERVEITPEAREKIHAIWPGTESTIHEQVKQEYPSDIIIGPKEEGSSGGPWKNARDEADRRGLVTKGKIGRADCLLFKAKDIVSLLEQIRLSGPYQFSGTGEN